MFRFFLPLLNQVDPESAHNAVRSLAPLLNVPGMRHLARALYYFEDKRLEQNLLGGLHFANPVGLAAGFDKYGAFVDVAHHIGFGFEELGSISAQPRLGNAQPRLFRLPEDEAIVNRMGLNNDGADVMARILQRKEHQMPLGINIVKTHDPNILGRAAIMDFVKSFETLAPLADYITLNISCPNTAEGKTFEEPESLDKLLAAIRAKEQEMRDNHIHVPPILVKLSPDRTDHELMELVRVSKQYNIDGYVLTNTTAQREGLHTPQMRLHDIGQGGLSGKPLFERSLQTVRKVYHFGEKPFIIAVGGIDNAEKAYQMITAGASLVQVYTGLIYQGPSLPSKINKGLLKKLDSDGFETLSQAIGSAVNKKVYG